ncbi:MAG: PKD domain-containing protein, partial [Flavobacteriales bacterium]|nr:PKD domain-containing protein [Flavobacteriales bacterium]
MKTDQNIASTLRFVVLSALLFAAPVQNLWANHLIGGELTYACQGNDNYQVTLKIFRDCNCTGCAQFDDPAYIFVYDGNGNLDTTLSIPFPGLAPIPAYINNPCLSFPLDICVEEADYVTVINLPPTSGGYNFVHQRCCRNNTILNIATPDDVGSTYLAHVPNAGLALCNSSPPFTNFPPVALCVGDTLVFDHSATDPDGDSLVYELCTPYSGASPNSPKPGPFNPPGPPPYSFVNFIGPYTATAPFNGILQMSIDPQTGLLTGAPSTVGQFVVGICVSEYRNGFLVSTNKRDVQFNVVECNAVIPAAMPAFFLECDDYTVNFINNTVGAIAYTWVFGDGDSSDLFAPSHTYLDTGVYFATLISNPGWTCADTAYSTINIYPGMTADYSYITHCADSDITFTDLSVSFNGLITNWTWNFGDGGSSTSINPTHNFNEGGFHTVQLSTLNDKGCLDISTQDIYVYLEPEPIILFNAPCEKTEMTFEDGTPLDSGFVATWDWDIAGQTSGNASSITHTFDTAGFYDITLSVTTDHGCDGTRTITIIVKPIPGSNAGIDDEICPAEIITIGGVMTAGYQYDWVPPTGLNSASVASPTLALSNDSTVLVSNTYVVTTSLNGCSSTDTVVIGVFPSINPSLPTPPEQCLPNNQYYIEVSGVFGQAATFDWEHGDGTTSSEGSSMDHTYGAVGTYTVTVTIEDNGCTEAATTELTVYDIPFATFMPVASDVCTPFNVEFEGYSSDSTIADSQYIFIWDFGDGSPVDSTNPTTYTYSAEGTYQPSLTIILGDCADFPQMTESTTVTALPQPTAGFYFNPNSASLYDPIVNINSVAIGADDCWIVLSPGDTINACSYAANYYDPNAPYNETTTHEITQIVRNDEGCWDTITRFIDIRPEYIFFAPSSFTPNGDGINDGFMGKGFGIVDFEMMIYNRWGDLIWKTDDQYERWDGVANHGERRSQQEVFVYIVNITDIYDVSH